MLKFARNKLVNVVAKANGLLAIHGVLDDDIYSLDIDVEVRQTDLTITAIAGKWHRFTTPDCPRALAEIEAAVGWCLTDVDFSQMVHKVVGRKACRHFANLMIECADAAREAELILNWQHASQSSPALTLEEYLATAGSRPAGVAVQAVPQSPPAPDERSPGQAPRAQRSTDGFVVDLHVHTFPASACATDSADAMIQAAKRIGLDAICLTDHNFLWSQEQIEALRAKHDFAIFRGNEITTDQGDMLVFGFYEDVQGIITIEALQRAVAAAAGILIAAHPFRGFLTFNTTQLGLTPERAKERPLFRSVDAIEVLNGKVTPKENEFAQQVAAGLGYSGTGGSDAHAADEVGQYATEFAAPLRHEQDLVDALRSGAYRAVAYRDETSEN